MVVWGGVVGVVSRCREIRMNRVNGRMIHSSLGEALPLSSTASKFTAREERKHARGMCIFFLHRWCGVNGEMGNNDVVGTIMKCTGCTPNWPA